MSSFFLFNIDDNWTCTCTCTCTCIYSFSTASLFDSIVDFLDDTLMHSLKETLKNLRLSLSKNKKFITYARHKSQLYGTYEWNFECNNNEINYGNILSAVKLTVDLELRIAAEGDGLIGINLKPIKRVYTTSRRIFIKLNLA